MEKKTKVFDAVMQVGVLLYLATFCFLHGAISGLTRESAFLKLVAILYFLLPLLLMLLGLIRAVILLIKIGK